MSATPTQVVAELRGRFAEAELVEQTTADGIPRCLRADRLGPEAGLQFCYDAGMIAHIRFRWCREKAGTFPSGAAVA